MKTITFPEVTYIDTRDYPEYDEYLEWCADNNIEPAEEGTPDYYDWCTDTVNIYVDDFFDNLTHGDQSNCQCLVTGNLGLWNGNPTIMPVKFDSIVDAIYHCIEDMDDYKVVLVNSVIEVYGYHHDGTNCFEIHKLSDIGIEKYDDEGDYELSDDMFDKWEGYLED